MDSISKGDSRNLYNEARHLLDGQAPNHGSRAHLGHVSAPPSPRMVHSNGFLERRMSL
jgi:hypothetical protein